MTVPAREWLGLIEREYLRGYVTGGGGAVKFAIGPEADLIEAAHSLRLLAGQHRLAYAEVNAAQTKLHMIQDFFFAIARTLDWNAMAQRFVEALFARQGYEWPRPGVATPIREAAELNRCDDRLLRIQFHQWLTAEIMNDREMAQDFRIAIAQLCLRRLEPEDAQLGVTAPILQWLTGELRRVGDLKATLITSKITRHNGRAMLRSLCRWVRLTGQHGLCLVVDIRQLSRTGKTASDGIRYTAAATLDAFEVLRQLVDDSEQFSGLLVIVLADEALIGDDPRRSLNAYMALKMRIWPDVRAEGHDNPLAPLVEFPVRPPPGASGQGRTA
jgi:hypothetical protein